MKKPDACLAQFLKILKNLENKRHSTNRYRGKQSIENFINETIILFNWK